MIANWISATTRCRSPSPRDTKTRLPRVQLRGQLKVKVGNVLREIPVIVLHRLDLCAEVRVTPQSHSLEAGRDDNVRAQRINDSCDLIVAALIPHDPA